MKGLKGIVFFLLLLLFTPQAAAVEPTIADYTAYPVFQLTAVAPNVLIILDNSMSMNHQAYFEDYDHTKTYYGYFEPRKKYAYGSNVFVRDENGTWDGNFLNWLTMRRIDVARKVIMGGLATARTGGGNQTNIGEAPGAGFDFTKSHADTVDVDVTPFASGTSKQYVVDGGYFYVDGTAYTIRVDKNMIAYPDEAPAFVDGNIAGVLQKVGDRARWGNEFFNYGTGKGSSGGTIVSTIGTNMTSLITDLQNTACNTFTPLAEAYYTAMQYFKQEDPQSGLDYPNSAVPCDNIGDDPYWDGTQYVYCAKSFVILLTDGNSTYDMMVPESLKNVDPETSSLSGFSLYGSHYLDDIALHARTRDLRADLDGDQNLILYTVYAFGDLDQDQDTLAEQLLKNAAKNGGFVEKDGTFGPSSQNEWDEDNNGVPDTYYKAEDGHQLEAMLLQAINDILRRAASGTAVSVLATSGEGEANLVQAYFLPTVLEGYKEVKWLGYLQSLWVDPYGNLREDSEAGGSQDYRLNVAEDKILSFFTDPSTGDTKVKRFNVSSENPYPDLSTASYEVLPLNEIKPLWEAGKRLASRAPSTRKIFTFLDKDGDKVVDEPNYDDADSDDEVVVFNTSSADVIKPYLGVRDSVAWSYLGANHDARVSNLINWVRGDDISGLRSRTVGGYTWKLGDIVNSTPISISRPPDNFHIIYSDESYQSFYENFKDRETVVYVGANDGMLHAFTSWQYDPETKQFSAPQGVYGESIGDELWAYLPHTLLPHLKWLPMPEYTHVFYVDLKPKVFDAKILPDDTHYTDNDSDPNWGTILIGGLNMGGKQIAVSDDFDGDGTVGTGEGRTFYPTYFCLDVTKPREPKLLWERTYTALGFSTSVPAIVRVGDEWFAVFGSGPTTYDGMSSLKGHVFVVNLATGEPYKNGTNDWLFETGESGAFMNSPVSLDRTLNFNVDAVYFGESYLQGGTWMGKLYKVTIPCADSSGAYDTSDLENYSENPLDSINPWRFAPLFNVTRPVTSPLLLSKDNDGNIWVYGGSGRYLSTDDKTTTDTQYIFGIKDPFFNKAHSPYEYFGDNYYLNYSQSLQLTLSDVLNSDNVVVAENGEVFINTTSIGYWVDLIALARAEDGWIRTLTTSKERVLVKPSILAGIVFTPSFVPNGDICGCGGDSYMYGFYYETGTAYYKPSFAQKTAVVTISGVDVVRSVERVYLGAGKASSLGIHVGAGKEATGYVQQSTGNILNELLNPAFFVKSGLRSWRQK